MAVPSGAPAIVAMGPEMPDPARPPGAQLASAALPITGGL
jgi:hypothetical protein